MEYQPDFVAETADTIYMLEPKQKGEMDDPVVQAKKTVAEEWCKNATTHAATYAGKPWKYALIPHDVISENMTLAALASRYVVK